MCNRPSRQGGTMKIPRLWKVSNLDSGEVFTVFATTKDVAISSLPIGSNDIFTTEEVRVTTEDGCTNAIYRLKDIPIGSYFRTVNANSLNVGKTVMVKERDSYNKSDKKYCCIKFHDVCSWRMFKPSQYVIIDFTF